MSADATEPVLSPPPQPRFCPACGTSLPAPAAPCPRCASRSPLPALGPAGDSIVPVKAALALYFALLGVIIAITIPALIAGEDPPPGTKVNLELAADAGLAMVVSIACFLGRRTLRQPLTTPGPRRYYILAPLIAVATVMIASIIVRSFNSLFGLTESGYSDDYIAAGYPWPLLVLSIAIMPAIFEELAFRGFIGSALERAMEPREALIVTALLFATLHLSPAAFPHLFLVGLGLGYLRRASGSLYPCMLLHFCHNGLVLLAEYLGI